MIIYPLSAQDPNPTERVISGRLTASDGAPIPGVNIVIKGTTRGTVSDIDGRYSISAPIGSTLVFSFIGMETREVLVTAANLKSKKAKTQAKRSKDGKRQKVTPSPLPISWLADELDSTKLKPGQIFVSDEAPSYVAPSSFSPGRIRAIKPLRRLINPIARASRKAYKISEYRYMYRGKLGATVSSSIGFSRVAQLPDLQSDYVQGSAIGGMFLWQGPELSEINSWGPAIQSLAFDGSSYIYDNNGRLVPRSSSGAVSIPVGYDPLTFFRTGIDSKQEVAVFIPIANTYKPLAIDLNHNRASGVIPNSSETKYSGSMQVSNLNISDRLRLSSNVEYQHQESRFVNQGASHALLMQSILSTPISFDNGNGLGNEAVDVPTSYLTTTGSDRSFAPGQLVNPYRWVNEVPSNSKQHSLLGGLSLKWILGDISITSQSSYRLSDERRIQGIPASFPVTTTGRLTDRNLILENFNQGLVANYNHWTEAVRIKGNLSYKYHSQNVELDRFDGFGFVGGSLEKSNADSTIQLNRGLKRQSHEVTYSVYLSNMQEYVSGRITNSHYYSNTLKRSGSNFYPAASVAINFHNIFGYQPFDVFKVYGSYARTLKESALLWPSWSYQSLNLPTDRIGEFYESNELFFHDNLQAEDLYKFDTGLEIGGYWYNFDIGYFNYRTNNLTVPVMVGNSHQLANAADVVSSGLNVSAFFQMGYYDGVRAEVEVNWSLQRDNVIGINSADDFIPLSGTADVQAVLAPGQPVGAIYGSDVLRDNNGREVIDADGFPVIDPIPRMIGNPIPDQKWGIFTKLRHRRLRFSFLLDFKLGGDQWNGTNAYLNYIGRGKESGNLRNLSGVHFAGVNPSGNLNNILVSLADPASGLDSYYWRRYGTTGIAALQIEDTSWIRLSNIGLSYTVNTNKGSALHGEIVFALTGNNLWQWTNYSGVDPASNFLGYNEGFGLDYFNLPSARSYAFSITLKI